VLASYNVARAEVSFELARADAYVFGDDDGKLRHTHATHLLELGEHPKVVQARLGHSTITITMKIYSHVTPTMQQAAADHFAAHLGGAEHITQHMARK